MPIVLAAALLGYAVVALVVGWWLSAAVAPVVAWLLWRRHPRARFTTYVFLSVLTARRSLIASWPLALCSRSAPSARCSCPPRGAPGPGSRAGRALR